VKNQIKLTILFMAFFFAGVFGGVLSLTRKPSPLFLLSGVVAGCVASVLARRFAP